MTEQRVHHSGEVPIILPTPVAIMQHHESKFSVMSRFFAWVTACCLSVSVLVALVSVTSERNNLSTQLACRAQASVDVNKAIVNEQIALADHSVLVGRSITIAIRTALDDPDRQAIFEDIAKQIDEVDADLVQVGTDLRAAVQAQAVSTLSC